MCGLGFALSGESGRSGIAKSTRPNACRRSDDPVAAGFLAAAASVVRGFDALVTAAVNPERLPAEAHSLGS
jgi:hypothetical protein